MLLWPSSPSCAASKPMISLPCSSDTTMLRCRSTFPSSATDTSRPRVSSSTAFSPMLMVRAVMRAQKLPDPVAIRMEMVASREHVTCANLTSIALCSLETTFVMA
ncbi:hypothetical protein PVAP13_3NG030880 [Panicum virgatum]|uniref:Uncharacterized protein n=1 Tax=Panicum virgatum TaxID=38727 RepID=A0A8T0U1X6_PANVG|nr:hypothetical protein PVAP13_3NG030880 [Panicum virgatum]